jgi:alkyl hydroperoxide reductase subunit AhpF
VLVATGGNPRRLGVEGEVELEGRGVSRCATCDGAFFAQKPVVVLGGGDTALDEALYLAGIATKITIIHQSKQPIASAALVTRARGNDKIEWISRASITEIIGGESVEGLRLSRGEEIATAAVFIAIGFEPETALLRSLIEIDPMGHAPVDIHMQTSIPGLSRSVPLDKEARDRSHLLPAMGLQPPFFPIVTFLRNRVRTACRVLTDRAWNRRWKTVLDCDSEMLELEDSIHA